MLNQSLLSTEANFSGVFLKNYIDFVEEIPNDVQKWISRCKEIDYKTKNLTNEIDKICEQIVSRAPGDKKARVKIQQLLVKLTEFKDEKIHISQTLSSLIEAKNKIVNDSFQNNNVYVKDERSPTPAKNHSANSQQHQNNTSQLSAATATGANVNNNNNNSAEGAEKATKRVRKTRIDNLDVDSFDDNSFPLIKSATQLFQSGSLSTKRANNNSSSKKAKKRKATKKQAANTQIAQDPIDEVIQDDGIDPDETTYCICQQISYGEMIFCENDTCPIEWFHFSCVDLTSKPKGRWFCPQCRGDKASVINKNLRKKQQEGSSI